MIQKLTLYAIHSIVDLIVTVFQCLHIILRRVLHFAGGYRRNTLGRVRKVPQHIGFLIAEDNLSFSDLANLIVWSATVGITCVSLYDHDGVIKKNKDDIFKQLTYNVDKQQSTPSNYNLLLNGTKDQITVKVLCHLDGKWEIVKAANGICNKVHQGLVKSSDVNTKLLTDHLQLRHSSVDPDIIVVFGPVQSTIGYLPWHIRLTEIFSIPSHRSISQQTFYDVIYSFERCEKRFGT